VPTSRYKLRLFNVADRTLDEMSMLFMALII
jgi:hypothetical protein